MKKRRATAAPVIEGIEPAPRRYKDILDRELVRDPRLSYRALGVAVRLLSNAPGFAMTSLDLAKERIAGEGRDAVRTALGELEAAGYLSRTWKRLPSGQCVTKTMVADQPMLRSRPLPPAPENPSSAPAPENPFSAPTPEKPAPGHPITGGQGAKSSKSNTSKNTTSGAHSASNVAGLEFPPQLDLAQRAVVVELMHDLSEDVQQQLLDELSRALSLCIPKQPVSWFRHIANLARDGAYVPALALEVSAERRRRAAQADEAQKRAEEARTAQARWSDPAARARSLASIREVEAILSGLDAQPMSDVTGSNPYGDLRLPQRSLVALED